ncbi:MAG: hypothetical protein ACOC0C_06860 [Bacteroidota bacterium]
MRRTILISLILLTSIVSVEAQRVENVRVTAEDGKVVVLYDLNKYSERYLYDVEIYFQSTTKITPFALSGDVGEQVLGGNERKIVWDLYQDIDGLSGNLKAIINVTDKERIKHLGGQSNAFLSVLVPVAGNYFVQKNKLRPIMTHILVFGGTAATLAYYGMSNDAYHEYLHAREQDELNASFSDAQSKLRTANIIGSATAAIWLYDILHVAVRGSKNNKIHPYRGLNKPKTTTSAYILPTQEGGAQAGLVLNF